MKIPKTFYLAGVKWKVKESAIQSELGLCYRDSATIFLKQGLEQPHKEIAFLHELVHAIKFTTGDGGPHNEQEVDAFAYLLHQFLETQK